MASSVSNLVDNLAEGVHKIKFKDCDCFLQYESVKGNLIIYKCSSCNKDYSNKLDEKFKKRFKNTIKFFDNDSNKFILFLRKGVYPYEYMDDLEKFNETTLPEIEKSYRNLIYSNLRVSKDFEDLYLKSDTLLWVMFLKISEKSV